jgi:hypothetical protein
LFPETTACGNFNTVSAGSVTHTALSSISGGKKVSKMWVASSKICCYNCQVPILGSAQQNTSLSSLLLSLAAENHLT